MTVKTADVNLEHAIRAGDVAVVTSLFSALSPADASKHRTAVLQLLKQMDATRFSDDKATLKRWGGAVTDAQWRAAQVAILFSGTARDIATHVDFDDELIALARQHPRPGFSGLGDALLDRSLFFIQPVQQLIVAGVIARPTSDNYAIALMGLPNRTSRGVPFEAYWKADPGLRSVLLRVLDVQGTSDMNLAAMDKYSHASRTWTQTLLNLIANGAYSRMEILERVLNTLESDWPQFRAGWFSRFHVELAPTIDELRVHRPRYQRLTASRIPPTVTLALDVLATLDADAPLHRSRMDRRATSSHVLGCQSSGSRRLPTDGSGRTTGSRRGTADGRVGPDCSGTSVRRCSKGGSRSVEEMGSQRYPARGRPTLRCNACGGPSPGCPDPVWRGIHRDHDWGRKALALPNRHRSTASHRSIRIAASMNCMTSMP
jgi:hypothetical protein